MKTPALKSLFNKVALKLFIKIRLTKKFHPGDFRKQDYFFWSW